MENSLLQYYLDQNIIILNDLVSLTQEDIMNKILTKVHKYKITQTKDGRWTTRIVDGFKADGTRMIRKNSKQDLYDFLIKHYGITKTTTISFKDLFYEWVEYKKLFIQKSNKGMSETTITRYQKDMELHVLYLDFAKIPVDEISPILLTETFIKVITTNKNNSKTKAKSETMKEAYFKNLFGYFNGIFQFAVLKDYLEYSPMTKVDKRMLLTFCTPNEIKEDEERILNEQEISLLNKSLDNHIKKHPLYMPSYAIKLALLTGMRVGEIAALQWQSIRNNYIYIDHSEHIIKYTDKPQEVIIGEPKNRKHRKIPITKEIESLLNEIKALNVSDNFLFVNKYGLRHTGHDIACALDRRASEAGIKKTSIHGIRKTISSILNTMLPRSAVANLLGHLETTNERFYDFDVTNYNDKLNALSKMSRKVTDLQTYKANKKIAEAL